MLTSALPPADKWHSLCLPPVPACLQRLLDYIRPDQVHIMQVRVCIGAFLRLASTPVPCTAAQAWHLLRGEASACLTAYCMAAELFVTTCKSIIMHPLMAHK